MSAETIAWLVTQGALGVTIVILVPYTWRLHLKLQEVQELRVADAKATTEVLLEMAETHTRTIHELTTAVRELPWRLRGGKHGED